MSGTQALLTEYANGGAEWAFGELVSSYVHFVFSTALRIVGGDRPLAEDVTQAVFTDLARKAVSLPKDVQLGGWLHRHTYFVARKTLRRERRRIAREKRAMELHGVEDYTEANLAQLALVLDEVINDLSEEDRNAIVLRFFEERDFRSIGETLGSSEDAARMRVSRAVEKMGVLLKRRGIVLTAAGISFVLSGKLATAAPTGLATRIVYVELARPTKSQGIFEILREACLTRLNIGIISAALIVAFLTLLISGRHTGAKPLPDPDGKTFTPAEFADLAVEEPGSGNLPQAETAPVKPEPSPAPPSPATARPIESTVQTVTVKAVAVNAPRPPPQTVSQPTATSFDSTDNSSVAQSATSGQGDQSGNARRQRPGLYGSPQVPPSKLPSKLATNSLSLLVEKNPPDLFTPTEPWSLTRTMATIDQKTTPAPPNRSSIPPARTAPQNLPASSGASGRRDGKP